MKKSLRSLRPWLVALLAFSSQSISKPEHHFCGIPDDYLEARGFLLYVIGEMADQQGTSFTDLGPILLRFGLAPECRADDNGRDESDSCMHTERAPGSSDAAQATFERAKRDYPDQIVAVGWATSDELGPGRLPIIAGMLYVPGYPVHRFSADQESCDR